MRSLFLKIFLWFWATQILIGFGLSLLATIPQRDRDQSFISARLDARAVAAAIVYETGDKASLQDAWFRRDVTDDVGGPNGGPGGDGLGGDGPGDDGPPPDAVGAPPDGPDGGAPERRGGPEFAGGDRDGRFRGGRGGRRGRFLGTFYVLQGADTALKPQRLVGIQQPPIFKVITLATFVNGEAVVKHSDGTSWLARLVTTPKGGRYMAVVQLRPWGRFGGSWYSWFVAGPGGWWRLVVIACTMGIVCYALARYLTSPAIKLRQATQEFANGNLSVRVGPQMGRRRDELADLGRDFDLMAERIESLRVSERRLLGDISHELRSPLARMQVALDLADQGADDQTRSYLMRIEEEAQELNAMINQLLTLTRLESAAPSDQPDEMVDLEQLVAQVCSNADFEAKSHGSRVELVEKAACRIKGNGQLLRSAVENVVRNAILHAPGPNGIEISLQVAARVAKIRVRDHGPGVPVEALTELFRPFYRVAEDRDRQSGGVGLGLSITQRAVQLHGGSVTASNAPGGGLLVEMSLPLSTNS